MKKSISLILISFLWLATTSYNALASTESKQFDSGQPAFSQGEVEQILAPIALYPDSVLTHVLIASTYPLEVIQAHRWVNQNSNLSANALQKGLDQKDWDPSVKALVPFPRILERLNDDLAWTEKLGSAFLQDEELVLASIQSLRQKADQAGNLNDIDNMSITREDKHIIIQPTHREYVYIPYYDTRVIYGRWHWSHYPPIHWGYHHSFHRHHHGFFFWHPRVHVSLFHSPLCAFHWRDRHLVRLNYHHYRNRRHNYHNHHSIIQHASARRWQHNSLRHRVGHAIHKPTSNLHNPNRNLRKPTGVHLHQGSKIGRIKSGLSNQHQIGGVKHIKKIQQNLNQPLIKPLKIKQRPEIKHLPKIKHQPKIKHRPKIKHQPKVKHQPKIKHRPRIEHRPKIKR